MTGYPCCCVPSTIAASTNQCIKCPSSEAPDGYVFNVGGIGASPSTYCPNFCSTFNGSYAVAASTIGSPIGCNGSRCVDSVCCSFTPSITFHKYFNLSFSISTGSTHAWKISADILQSVYDASSCCGNPSSNIAAIVQFESTEFSSTTKCHQLSNYSMTKVNTTGPYYTSSDACNFSGITLSLSAY